MTAYVNDQIWATVCQLLLEPPVTFLAKVSKTCNLLKILTHQYEHQQGKTATGCTTSPCQKEISKWSQATFSGPV